MDSEYRKIDRIWMTPEKMLATVKSGEKISNSRWSTLENVGKKMPTASHLKLLFNLTGDYSILAVRLDQLYPEEIRPGFCHEDLCVEVDIAIRKLCLTLILEVCVMAQESWLIMCACC